MQKKKNFFVGITTNGTMIGPEQASKLKNSGVDYVQISVESPVESEHDALRGKGTFKKCLESLRLLKEQGYRQDQLYITATYDAEKYCRTEAVCGVCGTFWRDAGTSFFPAGRRGHCNKVSLVCSERQMLDFILCRMKEKKEAITGTCVDIPVKQVADF